MDTLLIRNAALEQNRWVAHSLYDGCEASKWMLYEQQVGSRPYDHAPGIASAGRAARHRRPGHLCLGLRAREQAQLLRLMSKMNSASNLHSHASRPVGPPAADQ